MQQTATRSPGTLTLDIVASPDAAAWNAFLQERGPGHVFHRTEWDRVFGFYGLSVRRLAAVRGGQIAGVLPLVWQRSLLFGNQLVSLPWFDAAGILADDAEARDALAAAALAAADSLGNPVVQLRQPAAENLSAHVRTDKVLMRKPLEADPDELWNRFKPEVRNQVRKAEREGLRVASGGGELLDEFYRVYSTNMRDLGSPSHDRGLFGALLDAFPAETRLYTVYHGDKVIGAGLTIANGATLEIPWASSLRDYNRFCVNHLMYWRILQDACRAGYTWFNFGRSTAGSGPHRFKKQWGCDELPLYWYFLAQNDAAAAQAARPPAEKFGLAARVWSRMPLWLSRRLGPRIMRVVS